VYITIIILSIKKKKKKKKKNKKKKEKETQILKKKKKKEIRHYCIIFCNEDHLNTIKFITLIESNDTNINLIELSQI